MTGDIVDVSYFRCLNGNSLRARKCQDGFRVQVRGFTEPVIIQNDRARQTRGPDLIPGRHFDGLVRPFGRPFAYAVAVDGQVLIAPMRTYQPNDFTVVYIIAAYFSFAGMQYLIALVRRLRLRRRIAAIV